MSQEKSNKKPHLRLSPVMRDIPINKPEPELDTDDSPRLVEIEVGDILGIESLIQQNRKEPIATMRFEASNRDARKLALWILKRVYDNELLETHLTFEIGGVLKSIKDSDHPVKTKPCPSCGEVIEITYDGSFDNDDLFWRCSCGYEKWEFQGE